MKAQLKGFDTVTVYGEKYKNNVGRNVVAKIEGSDPSLKTQAVVLGGHLDHLGITNGIVMNGADDDASGSAVVMEMARLMAVNKIKPKRTVIFALWCGEELGLLGSNYFGEHPVAGVSMDTVVANFNMDMVGLGTRIGAPGAINPRSTTSSSATGAPT
jgi:Zn-dependent M28 family amino/carboxypeptidase